MAAAKRDMVTKTNPLIQASYSLSANEIKLIGLAIVDARETGLGITADKPLTIAATDFALKFGVTNETAYEVLKSSIKTLFDRQATYEDVHPETGKVRKNLTRWVSKVSYVEGAGLVQLIFAPDILPMITYIDGRIDGYTTYFLDEISGLKSAYAIRLFEILMQWKTTRKTPLITVEQFRGQMGLLGDEYPLIADFKKCVIDVAMRQINKSTDFTVTYEQKKTGRTITGFIFAFKDKKPAIEHSKPSKPKPPKNISTFVGLELLLFKEITAKHPEITEKYVRDYAEQSGFDVVQTLQKIKTDYRAAEEFSLEETD
jgi:plasmid replication initiation protein